MKICLIIAWLGNLVDIASTLYLCGNGYAIEANTIMAWLLQCPVAFAVVKIVAMSAVAVWLLRCREIRYARIAAEAGAVLYGGIAVYYGVIFTAFLWR